MKNNVWKNFWDQLCSKKNILELDTSTCFHYVVLEFLGYSPSSKISELEERRIRSLEKHTDEYKNLFHLYNKRIKRYILS